MKIIKRVLKLLCSLILLVPTSVCKNDVPLDDSFVLRKNFTNLYLSKDEQYTLKLDEYFRGNFLQYSMYGLIENDIYRPFFSPYLYKFTEPVQELVREDFPQTETQLSLPRTSIIYTEPMSYSKYFIFIDFQMNLFIYDIDEYFRFNNFDQQESDAQKKVNLISQTDLFSNANIDPDTKSCNNLIVLQKDILMINCQGSGNFPRAVFVIIDISDLLKPKATYIKTQFDYLALKDGKFVHLQRMEDGSHMIIVKENKTTCYFDVMHFDIVNQPTLVRRIAFFNELPVPDEQKEQYLKNITPVVESCEPKFLHNLTVDEIRLDIPFMQIQDVEIVHFHEKMIVMSDLNHGLLFANISCPNTTFCNYWPVATIKETKLSEIAVMNQEGLVTDNTIFVLRISPPWILEIQHETRNSPSIRRIYTVQDDEGQYVGFDLVDANQDYILIHLFSTQQIKPVFRVYKRTKSFLSIGHTEFTYSDFVDPGVFIQFINVQDNYLLLKTSDYFSILRVLSQQVLFNASMFNQAVVDKIVDKTINFNLRAKNMISQEILAQLNVMIVTDDQSHYPRRKYLGNETNESVVYYYNCGEPSLKISIDDLFEGSKQVPLKLKDLNEGDLLNLFETSSPGITQIKEATLRVEGCDLKIVLENRINSKSPLQLQCIQQGSDTLKFLDIIKDDQGINVEIQNLTIKSASIIDRFYDSQLREFFVLSNKTATGDPGAIVHVLKFYNLIAWQNSFDINKICKKELQGDFRFNSRLPVSYNVLIQMGIFISQEKLSADNKKETTILVFDLDKKSKSSNLAIIAYHKITVEKDVRINNIYIDRFLNIWVLISNQILNLYAMVPHSPRYDEGTYPLDKLYLKKQFAFNQDPDFQDKEFHSFAPFIDTMQEAISDKLIMFFGSNTMAMYRYVRGSADLKKLMILPLYMGSNDQDLEANVHYEFVKNKDIIYERYKDQFMIILLKRFSNNFFIGYSIFFYDIRLNKLGALQMKYHLDADLEIQEQFAGMRILTNDDESDIKIYLYIDEKTVLQYKLQYQNQIKITTQDRKVLTQYCSKNNIDLHYEVAPENHPEESVHIIVRALNTGLAIVNIQDSDQVTITKDHVDSNKKSQKDTLKSASYSLTRMFRGHNMSFSLNCSRSDYSQDNPFESCDKFARMHRQSVTLSKDIEVLSSAQQLLAFFVVDPTLIFFHQRYMHVYFPYKEQYYRYDLTSGGRYTLDTLPNKYFMKEYRDSSQNVINFLIFQTDDKRFGCNLIISNETYRGAENQLKDQEGFFGIGNDIFFQNIEKSSASLIQVPWNILTAEVYIFNQHENITFNKSFQARMILASYDPQILFNSVVKFYDLDFQPPTMEPVYKLNTGKIISCNRLNLDTFIINSMKLVGNSTLLAIGIQDFGLAIFDIIDFKIVKLVSFLSPYMNSAASRSFTSSLFINSIIAQEEQLVLHCVVNNNAVFSVKVNNGTDLNTIEVNNAYLENSIPPTLKHEMAHNHQGFVFIQDISNDLSSIEDFYFQSSNTSLMHKNNPSLKFFSFFGDGNSKNVGEMNLDYNEDCRFLQIIPYSMVLDNFVKGKSGFVDIESGDNEDQLSAIQPDQMITAAICGGTSLKIRAFDLYPDLKLRLAQQIDNIQIDIESFNAYNHSSKITLYVDFERNISQQFDPLLLAILFILLPLFILGLLSLLNRANKSKKQTQSNKSKQSQDPPLQPDLKDQPYVKATSPKSEAFAQILKENSISISQKVPNAQLSKYEVSNQHLSAQTSVTRGASGQFNNMLRMQSTSQESLLSNQNFLHGVGERFKSEAN